MRHELIIVTGLPRSGTSIIAGLLHLHGVWGGKYRAANYNNPRGYFENKRISALLKRAESIRHYAFKKEIQTILKKEKYPDGPWFVKYGIEYGWKMWKRFNPSWILVRRNWEDIKRSQEKVFGETYAHDQFIRAYSTMDLLRDRYGGVDIFVDRIVNGDYMSLRRFLKYNFGITFNDDVANQFIDRTLWHGKA